ncbi:MAG: M3 family oligoendopeptidase [Paracoccaceae bacterium]
MYKKNSENTELPSWNLSDLYKSTKCSEIGLDLKKLEKLTNAFNKKYKGKIYKLNEIKFFNLLKNLEIIEKLSGRLISFAYLNYCEQVNCEEKNKFLSDIQEKLVKYESKMLFLSLEINSLSEKRYKKLTSKKSEVFKYKTFFKQNRLFKPYQLSEGMENLLNEYKSSSKSSWCKLFDETISELSITISNKKYSFEESLNLLQNTNSRIRAMAGIKLSEILKEKIKIFSRITNTLAKEKQIEDEKRKFDNPAASRHLANNIDPKIIQNLRDTVVDSYQKTSHRYYKLKAKILNKKKLKLWDRNAPIRARKEHLIDWDYAKNIVLEAYHDFDPKIAEIGKDFFDNNWIHAKTTPSKASGAFSHPTVTDVHPYILLNYFGTSRDVMTLAHELGHGIHQVLASKQGELLSQTPLTLAETASVFGEMLTFERLLNSEKNITRRKYLLAGKIEDIINTVIRQISFYDFETQIHDKRKTGELTSEEISEIWMNTSKESLGDSFDFDSQYKYFWSYIPHFIHSPFYVYAYAFGDGMVNALFSKYKSSNLGFEKKYIKLLEAGGSKSYKELLKPFNLDIKKKNFWIQSVSVIENLIDELEKIT